MTQFQTIDIADARTGRVRRKLTPEQEAERIRKMKETKARQRAQKFDEADFNKRLAYALNERNDLAEEVRTLRAKNDWLTDDAKAARGVMKEAQDQRDEMRQTVEVYHAQVEELQHRENRAIPRITELEMQMARMATQHRALQEMVQVQGRRSGDLEAALSLLLAALESVNTTEGTCCWCGTRRPVPNGPDLHTRDCVIAHATRTLRMTPTLS